MSKETSSFQKVAPFALGGASGMMATVCIQPIDMVKVRIQLLGEGTAGVKAGSPLKLAGRVIAQDGFLSLYTGLSAGLLRQATYTTARMGIFRTVSNALQTPGEKLPFYKKAIAGLTAGGLGSVFGTPADVALIRMQADKTLPEAQRRGYKNVVDALSRMLKEEGVGGLFKGNTPVVFRAMALNVGMLSTYDQALESLRPVLGSNPLALNISAKFVSGFFASFFSLPFDFIKTRMQKQQPDPKTGQMPYKSIVHCARKVAAEEGAATFYRGFWTYYFRIAPHAMITLAVLDVLRDATKEW